MRYVLFKKCLAVLSVLVLTATGLWAAGEEEGTAAAAADKKYVTDPTTGEVVLAPEYGGTLTFTKNSWPANTDTLAGGRWASQLVFAVLDKPAIADWAINRDIYALHMPWPPIDFLRGSLVERWEQTDDLTIIFHVREGVHWHDKAPMNGRELTADDIVFNYHRMLGLGSGFTEPSPQLTAQLAPIKVESVAATDNYTVVFKLSEPSIGALLGLVDDETAYMYPPEVIKEHGDANDWKVLVGTGPFELVDVVEESSATWTKNPDYWGYDEKYPENRLPYVDELRALMMPEVATMISAIRTRKVDISARMSGIVNQTHSLQQTNPEIQAFTVYFRSQESFGVNVQKKPFDDIRVRKALQMALDLETANSAYFKGLAEMTPVGRSRFPGQFVPFEEWPEEVKNVFTYDPEGAEALLDEAGYPRGSDGIRFKTTLKWIESFDVGYAELAIGFWREIGVDVELLLISGAEYTPVTGDRDYEMVTSITANLSPGYIHYYSGFNWNQANPQDPWYDAKVEAAEAASSREELHALAREMDLYANARFWSIWGGMAPQLVLAQPWVTGYNSELNLGSGQYWLQYSRMWIDSALKREMGH